MTTLAAPAASRTIVHVEPRPLEHEGWRAGRPVEDPLKQKRWGFVTARPSEYLVHVRGGRVRRATSGQGATCFKWPWDSVAVVPTSLQRLSFEADQVTLEKIGVRVTGLAVYRIAEPLLAYRVLNFSFPERAQQKLEETLGAMLMGGTRRLVAGLDVDACLQKRKSALADELLREIAPVVGAQGHPDDPTTKGWGVVIDTIEVQEVRILSEKVFQAMQAPYRQELERRAQEARIAAQAAVRTREAELAWQETEAHARAEVRKHELAEGEAEARMREQVRRHQLVREEALAELASHAERAEVLARRAELARATVAVEAEERRAHAELQRVEGEAHAAVAAAQARAALVKAEGDALVASARHPLSPIAQAVASLVKVATE